MCREEGRTLGLCAAGEAKADRAKVGRIYTEVEKLFSLRSQPVNEEAQERSILWLERETS